MTINDSIPISFRMAPALNPFIITSFTAIIYHLAGTILESHCNISGMFSMGNTMPLSRITGSINTIALISMAACCVSAIVDINRPRQRETRAYRWKLPPAEPGSPQSEPSAGNKTGQELSPHSLYSIKDRESLLPE